ncbi:MAG: TonB family protein [Elusimicrobia bacterium]|nr:TonB family protein [Elusimicrobiota bacterium]
MLEVNEHIFGSPREMLCVGLALLVHVPLYFWQARPNLSPITDPITEIDFKVEQVEPEKPTPPPLEEKKEESFMERMKKAVGLATPKPMPKLIIAEKSKMELVGTATPNTIQPPTRMSETIQKQANLANKERSLTNSFDVAKIENKGAGLAGVGLGPGEKVGGGGTIQQKSTAFKIAQGDLPFAVKKGGGNELSNSDADAPRIALSNKTDKRVKSVSTDFFGTGGGTGGGDGSGEGGGGNLKDKGSSSKGLVGVTGGFSSIGAPGTDPVAGGGGLVGSPAGTGRGGVGGSSSQLPFKITGPLSGRRIKFQVLPPFPEWAREKGIFATVVIDFYVRHTGVVNANKTVVQRSSGYNQIDTLAVEALSQWRFEELDPSTGEQSGRILFTFKAM